MLSGAADLPVGLPVRPAAPRVVAAVPAERRATQAKVIKVDTVTLPAEPTGLVGDLNGDYRVDSADFEVFFGNFGGTGHANGDVNRDGRIDFTDFQFIEQNFGVVLPPPPPPPPPTREAFVGTNLDGISDWGTIGAFANLARTFRPWGTADLPYTPDADLPLTPDGYPLADAGTVAYAHSYPDGVYRVSWDGSADLSFVGMGADFVITSHVGDSWTAELELDRDRGDLLTMYVRNIDPANPLRDLKIMSPDVNYAISSTFRPVFVRKLAPFNGPLRMMDWTQTNNQAAVEWIDRAEPSNFTYTAAAGVDYETVIELANLTKKDVWVCVPHLASDDYVRRMARLFRDRLHPSLKVYVENSNEVWNPVFRQMRDNQAAAQADPTLTRQDDFGRQAQRVGKEIVRISNLFRGQYNAHQFEWQVRPVLGAFIASDYWAATALDYIQANYGDPKDFVHAIAIAPYVGNSGDMASIDDDRLTLHKLFEWMHARIDEQVVPWIKQHKALADRYGIKLHSYEAGQHLQAIDGTNEYLKEQAQSDPRMGDVYRHLIGAWHEHSGGGIFGNFALATPPTRFGHWGLFTSIDQATSVKWEAVMSTIAPTKYPG